MSEKILKQYYPQGQVKLQVPVRNGRFDGTFQAFYEDGSPAYERDYRDGKVHGAYRAYYPNGALWVTQDYVYGKVMGHSFKMYYRNGQLALEHFHNKTEKSTQRRFYDETGRFLEEINSPEAQPHKKTIYQFLYEHGEMGKEFFIEKDVSKNI